MASNDTPKKIQSLTVGRTGQSHVAPTRYSLYSCSDAHNLRGSVSAAGTARAASTSRASTASATCNLHYLRKTATAAAAEAATTGGPRYSKAVYEIERMRLDRESQRAQISQLRNCRSQLQSKYPGNSNWEFCNMLQMYRQQNSNTHPLRRYDAKLAKNDAIIVCVRKRPLNRKELDKQDLDVISVPSADAVAVHQPRVSLDQTKSLAHYNFRFDYVFDEQASNYLVYRYTCSPLIKNAFDGGKSTCFAYGQTGSGKTFTMTGSLKDAGILEMAANDIFSKLEEPELKQQRIIVDCSYFEIYGTKVLDLLSPVHGEILMLEDGHQNIQLKGLSEERVDSVEDVLRLIRKGESNRKTGQTSSNLNSSRSHVIFQIKLRKAGHNRVTGMCSFVDLAGNERGADSTAADRATRLESSAINQSLLALKECIRSLRQKSRHLPFRGSKLTQILRDSLLSGARNRTSMIATLSPSHRACDHTLNTLRYAEAVKGLGVAVATAANRSSSLH